MLSGCSTSHKKSERTVASLDKMNIDDADEEISKILSDEDYTFDQYFQSLETSSSPQEFSLTEKMNQRWGEAPGAGSSHCKDFDPSISDPKSFDLRTLVHYRQLTPQQHDPFGDYTLINEFLFMTKEKYYRMRGIKDYYSFAIYSNQDLENRDRALNCLKIPLSRPPLRKKNVSIDPIFTKSQLRKVPELDEEAIKYLLDKNPIAFDGKENPFKVKGIVQMFLQIMFEENQSSKPITPIIHKNYMRWSPEFLKKHAKKLVGLPFMASKLLIALTNGDTGRVLLTGKENEMELWILSQPPRTVFPHNLFRQAYRLHNGDVYLSLLMIENVLSRYRFWRDRNNLELSNRLGPILNQLGDRTDLFGPYYHFFGTLILGYTEGGFKSSFGGHLEKMNSIFAKESGEKQEGYANVAGAKVGAYFHKMLRINKLENWKNDPSLTDPKVYLDRNEDFTKRIREYWIKHSGDFKLEP
ncbi:MAG: hypothetical protein ACOYL6_16785 [Bacteriovoracaceae bacterium]